MAVVGESYDGERSLNEEWKDIPGYSGYQASSLGRVRSIDRAGWRAPSTRVPEGFFVKLRGRILKLAPRRSGHLMVMAGRHENLDVHVAVALAFHGERPFPGAETRHLDGDEKNNIPGNLKWGTKSENMRDISAHGGRLLTLDQAQEIRESLSTGVRNRDLVKKYGVNSGTIFKIGTGKYYRGNSGD